MTLMSDRPIDDARRMPRAALWLGIAGLVPFLASTVLLLLERYWEGSPIHAPFARLVLIYGAIVLSFLGAVRWGIALRLPDMPGRAALFAGGVLPALAGFTALLLPGLAGFWLLVAGFLFVWWMDRRAVARGLMPDWYGRLRAPLTAVALVCLAIYIAIA
jgi:hypothetical protein